MKFIVMNSGDYSVGLNGFEVELEVKSSDFDDSFEEEFTSFMKEKLVQFFEVYDGHTTVLTQDELDDMIDFEVDKQDLLNEGE